MRWPTATSSLSESSGSRPRAAWKASGATRVEPASSVASREAGRTSARARATEVAIARSRASTPSARSDGELARPAQHTDANPSARIVLRNRGDPPPAGDFVAVVKHCRLAGGDGALGFEELDSRLAARAA